ncbi:MAG: hypothetical protein RLZZ200_2735 [Pseudomonadota bacterium]
MSKVISKTKQAYRRQSGAGREIANLLLALAFGLVLLPPLIWIGGRIVLGEYNRDPLNPEPGGPFALWADYLGALAHGNPGYWLALCGAYLVYLSVRLSRHFLKV